MTGKTRVATTILDHHLQEIRALVAAGQASSVSAFLQHAVEVALLDAAGWQEMLRDALRQTGGPLTSKERAWADAVLSPERQKKTARKRTVA